MGTKAAAQNSSSGMVNRGMFTHCVCVCVCMKERKKFSDITSVFGNVYHQLLTNTFLFWSHFYGKQTILNLFSSDFIQSFLFNKWQINDNLRDSLFQSFFTVPDTFLKVILTCNPLLGSPIWQGCIWLPRRAYYHWMGSSNKAAHHPATRGLQIPSQCKDRLPAPAAGMLLIKGCRSPW